MKMKLVTLLSGVLSLGAVGTASAADMAVKARPVAAPAIVDTWTGFYIGVNAGYGWQANSDTINYFFAFAPGVVQNTGPGFNDQGGFGGGQLGYNWQAGKFVFGFETDIQGSDIKSSFR